MSHALPPIVLAWREHARLSYLAGLVWSRFPEFSDFLMRELDRATLVLPERIGRGTVTMGSRVEFAYTDTGIRQVVTLVFPVDEDVRTGKISVLTPVGAALIGLSEGQTIAFRTLRGQERSLTVIKVDPSAATDGRTDCMRRRPAPLKTDDYVGLNDLNR
ncbi:MAG: nucleoside diphosphate kinase regulator [Rhodospirillales bacterium]|jgi:regulator of nucleoside diphosphate kinase|nr:nucleoside diphosphate kinase regulator [Rhodospirillales bacterium]